MIFQQILKIMFIELVELVEQSKLNIYIYIYIILYFIFYILFLFTFFFFFNKIE